MSKYPRPSKQFDFITKPIRKISMAQDSLLRRTDYKGGVFSDASEAPMTMMMSRSAAPPPETIQEVQELEVEWSEADGVVLNGPTYLTLTSPDAAVQLFKFKVTDDHHFMFYANTRNFIDVAGKIEVL